MRKYQIINHNTKRETIVEANSPQEAAKKVGCYITQDVVTDIGQPKLSGMPISKAIEILEMATGKGGIATNPDYIDAQKLSIEALKCIRERRRYLFSLRHPKLQGETEE